LQTFPTFQTVPTFQTFPTLDPPDRPDPPDLLGEFRSFCSKVRTVAEQDTTARAQRLEAVDRLLPALFEGLAVREVFARIPEIAKNVLPHDAVGLPLVTEDREHIVPYASIGLSHAVKFDILRIPDYVRTLFTDPWDFELFRNLETEPHPRAGP